MGIAKGSRLRAKLEGPREHITRRRMRTVDLILRGYRNSEVVDQLRREFVQPDGQPYAPSSLFRDLSPDHMGEWLRKLDDIAGFKPSAEGLLAWRRFNLACSAALVSRIDDPAEQVRARRLLDAMADNILRGAQTVGLFPKVAERLEVDLSIDAAARSFEEMMAMRREALQAQAPQQLLPPSGGNGHG